MYFIFEFHQLKYYILTHTTNMTSHYLEHMTHVLRIKSWRLLLTKKKDLAEGQKIHYINRRKNRKEQY